MLPLLPLLPAGAATAGDKKEAGMESDPEESDSETEEQKTENDYYKRVESIREVAVAAGFTFKQPVPTIAEFLKYEETFKFNNLTIEHCASTAAGFTKRISKTSVLSKYKEVKADSDNEDDGSSAIVHASQMDVFGDGNSESDSEDDYKEGDEGKQYTTVKDLLAAQTKAALDLAEAEKVQQKGGVAIYAYREYKEALGKKGTSSYQEGVNEGLAVQSFTKEHFWHSLTVRQLDLVSKLALAQITQLSAPENIARLYENHASLKRQLKRLRLKIAECAEDEDESKIERKLAIAGKKKGAPLTPWSSGKKQRKK